MTTGPRRPSKTVWLVAADGGNSNAYAADNVLKVAGTGTQFGEMDTATIARAAPEEDTTPHGYDGGSGGTRNEPGTKNDTINATMYYPEQSGADSDDAGDAAFLLIQAAYDADPSGRVYVTYRPFGSGVGAVQRSGWFKVSQFDIDTGSAKGGGGGFIKATATLVGQGSFARGLIAA